MFNTQHSKNTAWKLKYSEHTINHTINTADRIHHKAGTRFVLNSQTLRHVFNFLKRDILVQTEGTGTRGQSRPATAETSHFNYGTCEFILQVKIPHPDKTTPL